MTPVVTQLPDGVGATVPTPSPEPCNAWPHWRRPSVKEELEREDFEDLDLFDTTTPTLGD